MADIKIIDPEVLYLVEQMSNPGIMGIHATGRKGRQQLREAHQILLAKDAEVVEQKKLTNKSI